MGLRRIGKLPEAARTFDARRMLFLRRTPPIENRAIHYR